MRRRPIEIDQARLRPHLRADWERAELPASAALDDVLEAEAELVRRQRGRGVVGEAARPLGAMPAHSLRPVSRHRHRAVDVAVSEPDALDGQPLVCAECGAVSSPDAEGWKAYLDDDGNARMFCEECAEREFGDEA